MIKALYKVSPIKDWTGWTTLRDYMLARNQKIDDVYAQDLTWSCRTRPPGDFSKLTGSGEARIAVVRELSTIVNIISDLEHAYVAAGDLGWQGEIAFGPFIAGLPSPDTRNAPEFILAWQENLDGNTYIAAPRTVDWLDHPDVPFVLL